MLLYTLIPFNLNQRSLVVLEAGVPSLPAHEGRKNWEAYASQFGINELGNQFDGLELV